MKILLANLPWFKNGYYGVRAGSRWPHIKNETERDYLPFPFYLAYSTSLLEAKGFSASLIDAIASKMTVNSFLKEVERFSPDILVVEISLPSRENDLEILKQIPSRVKIIICGLDVEATSLDFLKLHPFIFASIRGEYELPLTKLITALHNNSSLNEIESIIYREGDSLFTRKEERLLTNLNELPYPHRKKLPMKAYVDAPGGLPLPNVQMQASRGCPFQCSFCAWPQIMGKPGSYRFRKNEDIIKEMEYLVDKMKFKSIYFDDDTFNVGVARIQNFLDLLIEKRKTKKIQVPWAIMARADLMGESLLDKFKEAGLYSVKYGVESASQDILDNAKKDMKLEKAISMIKYTQQLGIKVHLTFMFGLPFETKETIQQTQDLAISLNPDSLQFSLAMPYPGTTLFDELYTSKQLIFSDNNHFDGNYNAIIKSELLSPQELLEAKDQAYAKWGEYLKLSRTPQVIHLGRVHVNKALAYYKHYGIWSLIYKTKDFLEFFIKHNLNIQRHHFYTITTKNMHLTLKDGEIRIFYCNKEITKGAGLHASFKVRGKRFTTSQARTKVNQIQKNEMFIEFDFRNHDLNLKQIFWIALENKKVSINVDWLNYEQKSVTDLKFSCMLSDSYSSWLTYDESGGFPEITDWQTMNIKSPDTDYIGVSSNDDLPMFQLKHPVMFDSCMVEAQNTSRNIFGRIVSSIFKEKIIVIPEGRTNIYRGFIELL